MQLETFIPAAFLLIIMPGPDVLFVITQSISAGRYSGVFAALGLGFGNLFHTLVTGLGLGILLLSYPQALLTVKLLGAAYLIYLAYAAYKERNTQTENTQEVVKSQYKQLFKKGLFMNILNPKITIFFISFLPQFISKNSSSPELEIISLGLIFTLMVLLIFPALAFFANYISKIFLKDGINNRMISFIKAAVYLFLAAMVFL